LSHFRCHIDEATPLCRQLRFSHYVDYFAIIRLSACFRFSRRRGDADARADAIERYAIVDADTS
jgi:hypothetical protein